jgi:hypothetical protein
MFNLQGIPTKSGQQRHKTKEKQEELTKISDQKIFHLAVIF